MLPLLVGASLTLPSLSFILFNKTHLTPRRARSLVSLSRRAARPARLLSSAMGDDGGKEGGSSKKAKKNGGQAEEAEAAGVAAARKAPVGIEIEDYAFEGISIGGHETCIIVPKLKLAFDIGRCPQRAIAQDFLFISHAHMDHIGGVAMYVATRGLYRMKPPTVIVPKSIKETVEKLFEVYRSLDGSELNHRLIGLDVDWRKLRYGQGPPGKGIQDLPCHTQSGLLQVLQKYYMPVLLCLSFTCRFSSQCLMSMLWLLDMIKCLCIITQGYIIYSVRHKLKSEYLGLPGKEIKNLKESGVEITNEIRVPEVAFTGDTMADFIVDDNNADALKAKVLIMEATFVDEMMSVEHAREYGHTHLSEVAALADRFQNKGILFIHFSARYRVEEIKTAMKNLPQSLQERAFCLLEGF